jgi:hypothetical protein
MSNIRGFTLSGVTLGALTGIKNMTFPGVTQTRDRVRTAGDGDDAGTAYYQNFVEGPIVVTFHKNATLRNTLLAKSEAGTTDTFTATKTGEHTYTGPAFVDVGEVVYGSDNEPEFTVTIEPETKWTKS